MGRKGKRMDAVPLLMSFGLTSQEAKIYCALSAEGELTGYETAKRTGISRSNIYTALAGLVEKGAACLCEGTSTRYSATPVEEFCGGKIAALKKKRDTLVKIMPERRKDTGGYLTVTGETNIMAKMNAMILSARKRIYASMSAGILRRILPQLAGAAERGLKVVLITEKPFEMEKAIVYHAEKKRRQIRLIVDSDCVLTGDIDEGEHSACLYSKKKNLVDLFKENLKNEIQLIQLTEGEKG